MMQVCSTLCAHLARKSAALLLFTALTTIALPSAVTAQVDMPAQMGGMFSDMVNATPPGHYDTARRGTIAGGGLWTRSRIVDPNPIAISAPSFRAGCGGIDLYGGSFSFIDLDAFVSLMEAVAANAEGYFFQIAFKAICAECMASIEALQRKIQQMNEMFADSCQLAQGIVNDGAAALTGKRYGEASIMAMAEGVGDVFQSFTTVTGDSPAEAAHGADPTEFSERMTGNLVWRGLKRSSAGAWFTTAANDEVLSVMMSLLGTVVVTYDDAADEFSYRHIDGNPRLLQSFLTGQQTPYYSCVGEGANGCLAPTAAVSNWTDEGFLDAVYSQLVNTTDGLVVQIAGATAPNADQRRLAGMMSGATGALFVQLAEGVGVRGAETFAQEAAGHIALEIVTGLVHQLSDSTRAAMGECTDAKCGEVREMILRSETNLHAEIRRLHLAMGPRSNLFAFYEGLMGNVAPTSEAFNVAMGGAFGDGS